MDPWWTDPQAGLIGGIAGSALGIFGGTMGALAGFAAPRGKCKKLVFAMLAVGVGFGVISLVIGLVALAIGQPYAVWYPLLLLGVIATLVFGINTPAIAARYRQAEMRHLEAEELRRS